MSQRLEFFFDFVSPYSYLAHSQIYGLGAAVVLKPMTVLKVMELVGNTPTTITCAAKGRYSRADLGRWVSLYKIPIGAADMRGNDSQACGRAVLAATREGLAREATAAIYHAFWGEPVALKTSADVLAVLVAAGLQTRSIEQLIDSPEIVAELALNTAEAAERGVFGAPTIFVGDDMFFGNDRLDFVRARLATTQEKAA